MRNRLGSFAFSLLLVAPVVLCGCRNVCVTEINGKTSIGPQFQNHGNNTQDVKYFTIQNLEMKLSNKWTMGVMYQRTDTDEGSGDNENLLLFEVGYPLWNAPKKAVSTAELLQIEGLERELRKLDLELAAAGYGMKESPSTAMVQSGKVE
jgi:hypothetical protein